MPALSNDPAKLFSYREGLNEKLEALNNMRQQLKSEFCGIDHVIDEIARLMEPWFVMPEAQVRPLIINLWGMTGTGKTSVVRRIAQILDQSMIQIDLGEYCGRKNFALEFFEKYSGLTRQPVMILLDEIQNPRTVNSEDVEVDREGLRGLWSLLSDGMIIPDSGVDKAWFLETLDAAIDSFEKFGGDAKLYRKTMRRTRKEEDVEEIVANFEDLTDEDLDPDARVDLAKALAEDEDDFSIPWDLGRWWLKESIGLCVKGLDGLNLHRRFATDWLGAAKVLASWLRDLPPQPHLDYKQALVIITGNVDEVYVQSGSTDPDTTPDALHGWSKLVTVPSVKQALLKRFRPEQVARLGNNHVLLPAFGNRTFTDIIEKEMGRIANHVLENFGVAVHFDPSVAALVFREGVVATQGARPVLSTTANLVACPVSSAVSALLLHFADPVPAPIDIVMGLDGEREVATFRVGNDPLIEVPVQLAVDSLRHIRYDDERTIVAVHEAGHALVMYSLLGDVPVKASAFSSDPGTLGAVEFRVPGMRLETKPKLIGQVARNLGGWAAETAIFGSSNISMGSRMDISSATQNVVAMIASLGMGETGPADLCNPSCSDGEFLPLEDGDFAEMRKLMADAKDSALKAIQENRKGLLLLAVRLLSKPEILGPEVQSVLEEGGVIPGKLPSAMESFEIALGNEGIERNEDRWSA